jgi:hypothetical protein
MLTSTLELLMKRAPREMTVGDAAHELGWRSDRVLRALRRRELEGRQVWLVRGASVERLKEQQRVLAPRPAETTTT